MQRKSSFPNLELYPNEVTSLPYFHSDIDCMQQVFAAVKPFINQNGHFLIRKSFSKPGMLTVSVLHSNGVKHFNIAKQENQYFLKDRLFPTVKDLVNYYKTHDVPNVEGITDLRLRKPILSWSSDGATSNWVLQKDGEGSKSNSTQTLKPLERSYTNQSENSTSSVDAKSSGPTETDLDSFHSVEELHARRKVRSSSLGRNEREYHSLLNKYNSACKQVAATSTSSFSENQQSADTIQRQAAETRPSQKALYQGLKAATPTDTSPYYSSVRNPYEEMAPHLIKVLQEVEDEGGERCECGLYMDEAELAMGWTMHLSMEPETPGKLFFMGPDGETAWNLPLEVSINLTVDQQDKIQKILRKPNT